MIALPFAASAATIQIDGGATETLLANTTTQIAVGDGSGTTIQTSYENGDGGLYSFEITNSLSGGQVVVDVIDGFLNQGDSFGFYSDAATFVKGAPGVTVTFDGVETEVTAGMDLSLNFEKVLGDNESVILSFEFDEVECFGSSCPTIDFVTYATPVPVPAAGFLLLGGDGSGGARLGVSRGER